MSVQPYTLSSNLHRFQKNCRLTLEIGGERIPLSFDDAIEFKIEIVQLLATGSPSAREVHATLGQWRIRFFSNDGGFAVEIRHPIYPIGSLALDVNQTAHFLGELQTFIDKAGQRS
jgi:hypothetical protein